MKRRWWALLAALAALMVLAAAALDPRLIVRTYTVEAEPVTAPVRIVVLADFHGCDYGDGASELIAAVEALEPDAVLLVGDIYDDGLPWDASDALVGGLAQRWPCYYVTGNHEYWTGEVDEILRRVAAMGVTVLDQSCSVLEVRGQRISFCGIPDRNAIVRSGAPIPQEQLAKAHRQAEPGTYTVLLSHRPELIGMYVDEGFDLVVCGHTHGGQVRIPGLINGLYAPDQGWFPKYGGGKYLVGDTTMIVSRGLARESTRLPRIFNRPELVLIVLE